METERRGPHQAKLRSLSNIERSSELLFRERSNDNDLRDMNQRKAVSSSEIETVNTCNTYSILKDSSGIPEVDTAKKNESVTASDYTKVKQSPVVKEQTDVHEAECPDSDSKIPTICTEDGHSAIFSHISGYSVNADNRAKFTSKMTVDDGSISGHSLAVGSDMVVHENNMTNTLHENNMTDTGSQLTNNMTDTDCQVKIGVQKDKMGLIKREGLTLCDNSEKGVPDVQYHTTVVKIKHTTKVQRKMALNNTATNGHDNMSIEGCSLTSGETPTKGYPHGKINMIPVVAVVLLMLPTPLSATALLKPPQALPEACYDLFSRDGSDCLDHKHFGYEAWYQLLNQTCCAGYPGMDFHCQTNYNKSGDQYSMMACLQSIDVPKGYTARMSYTSKGPVLHLSKLGPAYISPHGHETRSWNITYQYGTIEKSKCSGIGQEQLCKGDGNEDNLCTCQLGFIPSSEECYSGFTDEDPCYCAQKKCKEGTEAARNFSLKNESCEDLFQDGFDADFSCEKLKTVPTTPVPSTTTTAFPNNDSHPDKPGSKKAVNFGITAGIPVSIVGCILLVVGILMRNRISAIVHKCCDAVNRTRPGNAETGESRQMLTLAV